MITAYTAHIAACVIYVIYVIYVIHAISMPVTYVISDHDLICHVLADCNSGALYIDYHIAGYL